MRYLGLGGPVGALIAIVCVTAASDAAGRGPTDGLLSELGASATPGHAWYRLGQGAGALGALFVAAALRRHRAAGFLVAAGVLIGLATAVPCTTGCPLPLLDGVPPLQDIVHFLAAGLAFACWPAATWECAGAGPLRTWSARATGVLAALLAVLGLLTVIDRSSPLVGLGQRGLALVALAWLAAVGTTIASTGRTTHVR